MGVSFKIGTLFHEFVTSRFTVIALEMHSLLLVVICVAVNENE